MKVRQDCCQCRCSTGGILAFTLCAWFATCTFSTVSAQTLDEAYRSELLRLSAEQDAMRSALKRSKMDGQRARAKLVAEIESLSRDLTKLRAENNSQEMQLPQTSRLQTLQAQERKVDRRARQIETWLETHGISLSARGASEGLRPDNHEHPPLDAMVKAALDHVEEHGQLWLRRNQEYFDEDGEAKKGDVLRIAEVGAIAIKPDFRPLALASDGSLRTTPLIGGPSMVQGNTRTVGVMLFDPDDIRPTQIEAPTWQDWMAQGGVVMWVIGALAILALLVFIERIFAYARYVLRLSIAERKGPAAVVPEGDALLVAVRITQTGQGDIESLETNAAEAILLTQPYVRRGVSLLAVVASVAPLLGLLGTVTGMIGTFGMITEHGTGDPRLLSGGISEALLTTQFGLMVAIPALLFQTTLYRSGDAILRRVEKFAINVLRTRADQERMPEKESDGITPVRNVS